MCLIFYLKTNSIGRILGRIGLSERVGQEFDFDLRTDALVQYIIYGIEDWHVDVHVAIDFLHALGAEISLGNHLHLYLRTLHAVTFAYHGSEVRFMEKLL